MFSLSRWLSNPFIFYLFWFICYGVAAGIKSRTNTDKRHFLVVYLALLSWHSLNKIIKMFILDSVTLITITKNILYKKKIKHQVSQKGQRGEACGLAWIFTSVIFKEYEVVWVCMYACVCAVRDRNTMCSLAAQKCLLYRRIAECRNAAVWSQCRQKTSKVFGYVSGERRQSALASQMKLRDKIISR